MHKTRTLTALLSALVLPSALLLTPAVHAQNFYYQSQMPDGRIVFGSKPEPGAKSSKQIQMRPGNTSAPLSTPGQTPGDVKQQALESADGELRSAQQSLDAAKSALENGREPLPGERIGTASGASRLNETYAQRIKSLEDNVASAQRQLDEALTKRNAAR